jgi:hypothetical protein
MASPRGLRVGCVTVYARHTTRNVKSHPGGVPQRLRAEAAPLPPYSENPFTTIQIDRIPTASSARRRPTA